MVTPPPTPNLRALLVMVSGEALAGGLQVTNTGHWHSLPVTFLAAALSLTGLGFAVLVFRSALARRRRLAANPV